MLAAERYAQATSVDDYIAGMRENRDLFRENIERTEITEQDRQRLGGAPLRILVLTEDWCADSAQFVPMVARLARELPNVELRVLPRDQHQDLASNYRRARDNYQAIPVFILLDEQLRELGVLVERPERATHDIAGETRRFQQAHPELPGINRTVDRMPDETRAAVKANTRNWRGSQHERWARFLLEDLAAIVANRGRVQAA